MEVNPADLNFPKAVIARIIKEALPEGVTVSKEAKNAIARSAAIFILHATSLANDNAQSKKRKNLTADDILYAIHQLECDELEKPVKEALALFSQKKDQRQQHRREKRAENAGESIGTVGKERTLMMQKMLMMKNNQWNRQKAIMATHDFESGSGEQASSTADEIESSSRRSTTDDFGGDSDDGGDLTDTDSNDENELSKNSTLKERRKYADTNLLSAKTNTQSDNETKNLLDDVGEDVDDDFLNLQEMNSQSNLNRMLELDEKLFALSDEQLNYYTGCFLYLLQKSQGAASFQGALQGTDRVILDFFRKSSLDDLTLSKIWSLCDVNEDGFLNLAEFVSAMHLIVLHIKGSVPIPSRLPPSVRPAETPTRTLVHFEEGFACAASNHSLSNSSTKITAECVSSNSGNSQLLISNEIGGSQNGGKPVVDNCSSFGKHTTNGKQHSLSDDHLNTQRGTAIAKFSDVPPLLVDGHPTALDAATSSHILPEFARLFLATTRGPPPLPPHRDYNCTAGSGTKGHGRSVSLDLKTFSTLSSDFGCQPKLARDELDCSTAEAERKLQHEHIGNTDNFGLLGRNSPNMINEQLEEERTKLKQIRLQVQLRINEAERMTDEFIQKSANKKANKPTPFHFVSGGFPLASNYDHRGASTTKQPPITQEKKTRRQQTFGLNIKLELKRGTYELKNQNRSVNEWFIMMIKI
uniref:DNA polymerase epsilon subunit 3 n=1 Tax=Globodera rostochiensis TaxID=31243 RepID=A0A914HI37_GLORO